MLTDDETTCKQILLEIQEHGYPLSGSPRCLDWMVDLDILQPPETGNQWGYGSEYSKFKAYLDKSI